MRGGGALAALLEELGPELQLLAHDGAILSRLPLAFEELAPHVRRRGGTSR